ncbi:MAG: hypothetical protein IJU66_00765 [Oscillospiraceae bacterium]|nr:hypothetical protein [Oscillospiraceae bacterium]
MVILILVGLFVFITIEDAVSYLRVVVKPAAMAPGRRKRLISILVSMPVSLLLVLVCAALGKGAAPERARTVCFWMEACSAVCYLGAAVYGLAAAARAAKGALGKRAYERVSWLVIGCGVCAALGAAFALSLN